MKNLRVDLISCAHCKRINLPNELTDELLYFVGVVVGDGSLPLKYDKRGYRKYVVVIEKANRRFIYNILKPLAEKLFERKWSISKIIKEGHKIKYSFYLNSKPLYLYLTKFFDLPNGKKSQIVRMPKIIRKLSFQKQLPFIAGVIDTDWGISGDDKFGTHTASQNLVKDVNKTFKILLKRRWKIKKYVQKKKYVSYQLVISKADKMNLFKLFQTYFPLRNQRRIRALMPRDSKTQDLIKDDDPVTAEVDNSSNA